MGKVLYMRKGETHTAPVTGILAGELAIGSTVKLMENGVATDYLVVNQGVPSNSTLYDSSCDGTWLLRKNLVGKTLPDQSGTGTYTKMLVHTYLTNTFFPTLGSIEQATIKQVKIPYSKGFAANAKTVYSGANGASVKAFSLSAREVGFTTNAYNSRDALQNDGVCLSYFVGANDAKRKAVNDSATPKWNNYWWLRSPVYTTNKQGYYHVIFDGGYLSYAGSSSYECGVRPALIIPSTAIFDAETLVLKGVS